MRKLTKSELTEAVQRYARRHGYYTRTVRNNTALRQEAVREFLSKSRVDRIPWPEEQRVADIDYPAEVC